MCNCKQKEMDAYIGRRWPDREGECVECGIETTCVVYAHMGTVPMFICLECYNESVNVRTAMLDRGRTVNPLLDGTAPQPEVFAWECQFDEIADHIRPTHKPFKLWGWMVKVLTW